MLILGKTLIMLMLLLEPAPGRPTWSLRATWCPRHDVGNPCRKVSCLWEHNTQGTSFNPLG